MGRIIVVTGASGALGPHLLAELLDARRTSRSSRCFAPARSGPAVFSDLRRPSVS